jgi:hypothetical protein
MFPPQKSANTKHVKNLSIDLDSSIAEPSTKKPKICELNKSGNTTQVENESIFIDSSILKLLAKKPKISKSKTCCKWKQCDIGQAYDYDTSYVKYCNYCKDNSKTLFLIHDDDGDYWCYDCEESVFTRFFCIKCKKKKRNKFNNTDDED